jgi:hypothetical protein
MYRGVVGDDVSVLAGGVDQNDNGRQDGEPRILNLARARR